MFRTVARTGSAPGRTPLRPRQVAIGFGSNIGDRLRNLQVAAERVSDLLTDSLASGVYETEPTDLHDQPDFLNACLVGRTDLAPAELLERLKGIERAIGRAPGGPPFGPREIDLDILLYGDEVLRTKDLTLPHPRLHQRAFALVPLAEVAPNWQHGVLKRSIEELRDELPEASVVRTDWSLRRTQRPKAPDQEG
ncbi:MAG: 2-amino-4-hydroxy-6-hydroxymethyldihydropteridine diphosphokinase [Gemmatimonadota bacterium]|nr:2-amino-4-hydroxy-6-hydroxymethyldihydropteridine diphosphokinase [Gemmatimonadota bacterium]